MIRRERRPSVVGPLLFAGVFHLFASSAPAAEAPAAGNLRLNPVDVVEEREGVLGPIANRVPPGATGNPDLSRSADDVLPFQILDRRRLVRSGAASTGDFLRREMLASDAAAATPSADLGPDSLIGNTSNLTLRGFGSDETVILVNGRRLPEVVLSGRAATPPPPDVNVIPLSLIERVEVLPVSAAALYSGNPVGGVINLVLRPASDFTELGATYTNGRDAPQSVASLIHGRVLLHGALNLRIGANLGRSEPPTESELGYLRANLPGAAFTDPLFRATPNVRSAFPFSPLFGPGTSSVTSVAPGASGSGGLAAFNGRAGVRSTALFDSPAGVAASPASADFPYGRRERSMAFFGSATYDLLPWLQLGLDGISRETTANRGLNVFTADLRLAAASPLNPFGQDVLVSLNETAPQLGDNYGESRVKYSTLTAGLLARLPGGWRVTLDALTGRSVTRYRGVTADAARWQALVDSGGYKPLRDTQVFAPPAAFLDQVLVFGAGRGRFATLGDYSTLDVALRATNDTLKGPTGPVVVNVGGDFRRNRLAAFTDARFYGDGASAATPVRWSGRTLSRPSVFAELQAPLLPERWRPRGLRSIDANLAARYTASDNSGESNLAPSGGVKLGLPGGFSLRASVATSNRMPTPFMSRLAPTAGSSPIPDGGGEVSTVAIFDPVRQETYNVLAADALNNSLRPESAVTRTAGLIFERGQVHLFRAALDASDTRKSGELAYLGPQAVLNLESLLPGRVVRTTAAPGAALPGRVTNLASGNFNLAWRESRDWTTSLDYIWTEALGGRLELNGRWIWFQRYARQILPTSPIVDQLDAPDGSAQGLLRHRAKLGATWSKAGTSVGAEANYFHSRVLPIAEQPAQGADRIGSQWQWDFFASANLGHRLPGHGPADRLRLQLRVNNVLKATPPRYANDPSGAGVQPYGDWRGRVFSLSVLSRF